MEERAGTPTVCDSPVSQHSDVDDAATPADRPPSVRDLRMFTRFHETSSSRASTSEDQSGQLNEGTGPDRPFSPAHFWNNPNEAQLSSPNRENSLTALWKTVGTIFGFFLTALLAALGHYVLVTQLDQKAVDTSLLTQRQVSAVSILLSTIFKAALTASVGTCFAQHLWYLLRGPAMSLSTVEMLFILRTNIFALLKPQGLYKAPLLWLMALLTWGLSIATIYPAGALTVAFEAQAITELHNMSVMNPPLPPNLDLAGDDNFPTLAGKAISSGQMASAPGETSGPNFQFFSYFQPAPPLMYVANAIKFNNQIFPLPGHPGENSTYNLQFRGPRFECTTSQYNTTLALDYIPGKYAKVPVFISAWNRERKEHSLRQHRIASYGAQRNPNGSLVWKAYGVRNEQVCKANSALYNVSITFPRGVQTIDYTLSDVKPLSSQVDVLGARGSLRIELPPEPRALEVWYQRLATAIPISNEWAILDTLGTVVEGTCTQEIQIPMGENGLPACPQRKSSSGATMFYECGHWQTFSVSNRNKTNWYYYIDSIRRATKTKEKILNGTVFHTARFESSPLDSSYYDTFFDPRQSLNITEPMLNEFLANVTISAISLGTWWDMVPVTSTRYRSTYTLSSPLSLILPYSICIAAATVFMAIAIWSLWRNRVPAADGGFLQIMTARVGDTQLGRAILEGRVAAIDEMSEELKSLEIRYGKLMDENTVGTKGERLGFGTVDETISLRKRR